MQRCVRAAPGRSARRHRPPPPQGKLPYNGVLDCGRKLLARDGFLALWRGYGAYAMRCAPHAMICLLTMDTFMGVFDRAVGL